jgi:hypothetical protein
MLGGYRTATSRLGKKQILAYIRPNQHQAAVLRVGREGKTNQEVVGEALNAVLVYFGQTPIFPAGHQRIVRRLQGRAKVKNILQGPECRSGRVGYGGWFDEDQVKVFGKFTQERSFSLQAALEFGIKLITDVSPDQGDEWREVQNSNFGLTDDEILKVQELVKEH